MKGAFRCCPPGPRSPPVLQPGYSPSSSQRPRRGRLRRPGAMASRAPAAGRPSASPSSEPAGDAPGAGARERGRARPTAAPTPAVEGGSWRAAPEAGAQLGLEGRFLECLWGEWAWRVSRSLDPAPLPEGRLPQLYPVVCSAKSQLPISFSRGGAGVVGTKPALPTSAGQGVEPSGTRLLGGTKVHLPAVGDRPG